MTPPMDKRWKKTEVLVGRTTMKELGEIGGRRKTLESLEVFESIRCDRCGNFVSLLHSQRRAIEAIAQEKIKKQQFLLELQFRRKLAAAVSCETTRLKRHLAERASMAQRRLMELNEREKRINAKQEAMVSLLKRKLATEKRSLERDIEKRLSEQYRLRNAQNELKLARLHKTIETLKQKSDQGSQQLQGETMEREVNKLLRDAFPSDLVEPVAKGKNGGDFIHHIKTKSGHTAGQILIETKNTKAWSGKWVQKAKEDARQKKIGVVVLVTESFPSGNHRRSGFYSGIWVTDRQSLAALVAALRFHLVELFQSAAGRVPSVNARNNLYKYATGLDFRRRIEGLFEFFHDLRTSLHNHKTLSDRIFAKQERLLEGVISSTSGICGEIEGIIGRKFHASKSAVSSDER